MPAGANPPANLRWPDLPGCAFPQPWPRDLPTFFVPPPHPAGDVADIDALNRVEAFYGIRQAIDAPRQIHCQACFCSYHNGLQKSAYSMARSSSALSSTFLNRIPPERFNFPVLYRSMCRIPYTTDKSCQWCFRGRAKKCKDGLPAGVMRFEHS